MSRKLVIIGAGGSARDTLDIVEACNIQQSMFDMLGFIVDPVYGTPGSMVNERPILGGLDWLSEHRDEVYAVCAIGDSHLRWQVVQRLQQQGTRFCTLIHPSVILSRWLSVGEGVIIGAGCVITNKVSIGNHVSVNVGCTVSHDTVLAPFVTLSPGVHLSGNVTVGEGAYIGTGVNVIHRVNLGAWSIIGAGSAIIRDVPANTTTVGVPGQVRRVRAPGWHMGEEGNAL